MNKYIVYNYLASVGLFIGGLIMANESLIGCGLVCLIVVSCTQVILDKLEGSEND